MKLAIMQPYFMPYIGYFQLLAAVDEFVIYDNIEFSKKGWVNRNRILVNGKDEYITLPLKKDSDYLDIVERKLSDTWPAERSKLANKIKEAYRKAPLFNEVYPLIEQILFFDGTNLFDFLHNSLGASMKYLEIRTPLVKSSSLPIDHSLKSSHKVMALSKARNATSYINPIGGVELYDKAEFRAQQIELFFLRTDTIVYRQFDGNFVPSLSIIDVMMFNTREEISKMINQYKLE